MRVPVLIITGFLGSGKTTLLNHLLQRSTLTNSLVIVNEFGEVGIDHLLVTTPSENMRLLANGCLCCAVRGDLVETLADAWRRRESGEIPQFERVLIETSGLADPVPVIQTLVTDEELAPHYRLDTVVTLVDAVHAQSQLAEHPEAVKQIAIADLVLLTKTDLGAPDREALEERLHRINAAIEVLPVTHGRVDPGRLFGRSTLEPDAAPERVERWLSEGRIPCAECAPDADDPGGHRHHHHDHRGGSINTFTLYRDVPASEPLLMTWLTLLANFRGANLLRMKGIVNVDGRPVVVQSVQTLILEPVELARWPSEDRRTRVVFIVRDMEKAQFENVLSGLGADPAPGRADLLDAEAYARFVEIAKTVD